MDIMAALGSLVPGAPTYAVGALMHFGIGVTLALLYAALFASRLPGPGWLRGALFSLLLQRGSVARRLREERDGAHACGARCWPGGGQSRLRSGFSFRLRGFGLGRRFRGSGRSRWRRSGGWGSGVAGPPSFWS